MPSKTGLPLPNTTGFTVTQKRQVPEPDDAPHRCRLTLHPQRCESSLPLQRSKIHVEHVPEVSVEILKAPSVEEALVVGFPRRLPTRCQGFVDQRVDLLSAVDSQLQNRLGGSGIGDGLLGLLDDRLEE